MTADHARTPNAVAARLRRGVAAMQLYRNKMVTALRTSRRTMTAKLLFHPLLFVVGLLDLFECGRQGRRLHAHGSGFGPGAAPRANGAP